MRTFDSIAAAASALKVPTSKLRALKRKGADGFKNGRVNEGELLAWIKANPQKPVCQKSDKVVEAVGIVSTLARLEQAEARFFERMLQSDDLADAKAWLELVEQMRKSHTSTIQARLQSREIILMSEARSVIENLLLPLKQTILELAVRHGHACNPDSPDVAMRVLHQWAQTTIQNINTIWKNENKSPEL